MNDSSAFYRPCTVHHTGHRSNRIALEEEGFKNICAVYNVTTNVTKYHITKYFSPIIIIRDIDDVTLDKSDVSSHKSDVTLDKSDVTLHKSDVTLPVNTHSRAAAMR